MCSLYFYFNFKKFVLKPFKPKPVKKPQVPPKPAKEEVPQAVLSNVKTKPSQPRTPLPLESLPKPKKIKQAIKPVQPPPAEPKKVESEYWQEMTSCQIKD